MRRGALNLQVIMPGAGQGSISVYLLAMQQQLLREGHTMGIQNPRGSDLVAVRTTGLAAALDMDPTHILWIDSDMVFPSDLASVLASHDRDVVACNIIVKDMTGKFYATDEHIPDPSGSSQISSLGLAGLQRVRRVGMGIMMTKADVYRTIDFPWFGHRWYYHEHGEWLPATFDTYHDVALDFSKWRSSFEDWWLCERFERSGIDIWIDHSMSNRVAHLGQVAFYAQGVGIA